MGGFFKKVAGAFVYLDEDTKKAKVSPAGRNLEDVARETNDLINQLGGRPGGKRAETSTADSPSPGTPAVSASPIAMTADQVFVAGGIPDGPNSAQRVLKIITGLTMFPKEQQIVMVRAMDGADETWSEKDVMDDARRRQSALRIHLQAIEAERTEKLQAVRSRIEEAQSHGARRLEDIDQQIAELQKVRQEAVAATTSALNELELDKKQTEEAAEKARRGITTVINALSELITFFTGGEVKPAAKP